MPATPDEIVLLIVPYGRQRSRRIVLPREVAEWLRDALIAAVGKPPKSKHRKERNHR